MKKLRFGITGSGYMGRTHAEAIRRLGPDATLVAVWGGSRAPALAADYGAACESEWETLVRRPDIDAVIVTTPHHMHAAEACAALEAGKHVLVEKPLATKVEDCDRMIEAAARGGLVLAVAYVSRFRCNCVKARELIAGGAIGRLLTAHGTMTFDMASFKAGGFGSTWKWWEDPASVGHLINSLPHTIDLMRWFTGAEIASVSALSRSYIPGQTNEDTTLALTEFTNGAICSFYSSRALPAPPFPGETARLRFMGSSGLIDLDPYGELQLADGHGRRVVSVQPPVGFDDAKVAFGDVRMQAFREQMQSFVDGIEGRPMVAGNGADGRAGVETCLAMLTSSRERRWVQLG